MIGGNRSMIVRQQAIVSYTPHWIKLSRNVSSPTPVPLPDNTQLSQEGDNQVSGEIRICSHRYWRQQTHDLDREGTGISIAVNIIIIIVYWKIPQHDINELQKTATLGSEYLVREVLVYCTKCLCWKEVLYVPYILTIE